MMMLSFVTDLRRSTVSEYSIYTPISFVVGHFSYTSFSSSYFRQLTLATETLENRNTVALRVTLSFCHQMQLVLTPRPYKRQLQGRRSDNEK
jgi:hypothetical protein